MRMQQQLDLGGEGDVDVVFRTGGGGCRKVAAVVAVRTRGRRLGRCVEVQRNRLLSQCGIAAVKQPLFNPTPWMRVTAMEEERETDVQPGEEHKRERMSVCTKAKRRWNKKARARGRGGKGGAFG